VNLALPCQRPFRQWIRDALARQHFQTAGEDYEPLAEIKKT
jgi:hypothetical protein